MILTEKQNEALKEILRKYQNHDKYVVIGGYAGSGKAQPNDTLIPTPNGYKRIGDLQIGDIVFDRKGNPTKVLGVYPQGKKDKYQLCLADGRTTYCAIDHLWTVYDKHNRIRTLSTEDLLKKGLTNSSGYKYQIINNNPVQYSHKKFSIDPYMLGVFLGDGCCLEKTLTLSSEDEEIPKMIGDIINCTPIKNSEKNFNWNFKWNDSNKKGKPSTRNFFKNYQTEVMTYNYNKKIPQIYKYGDINQRLSLLQGLLDTDGSISSKDDHRYNINFTSTSLNLIKDVQEILWSLGYSSTINIDKRTEKYTLGICYSLHINIANEEKIKLFRLSRKKNLAKEAQLYPKHKHYDRISITNIIKCNEQVDMTCIYVDNPEHLYLTEKYIPTHNTTLVKFAISALESYGVKEEDICYAAYTGKACQVLLSKGNKNVSTLHKLMYESIPKPDGTFFRRRKTKLDYKIIVVDECSMIPTQLVENLLSYPVFVIFLGDPGQLPPVDKNADNHLLDRPDVFLDQIMRQALDSEIIQLSMKIRNQEPIDYFHGKDVIIMHKNELTTGVLTWADQILCATNKTRTALNNQMRDLLGHEGRPQDGDKVICSRNYWDNIADNDDPLVNGTIGFLKNTYETHFHYPKYLYPKQNVKVLGGDFISDTGANFGSIDFDEDMILTGAPSIDWKSSYKINRNPKYKGTLPYEFLYGYAITCHRAQGSQWNKVLVIEENFPFDKKEHTRWLYTSLTRAQFKVVLVH